MKRKFIALLGSLLLLYATAAPLFSAFADGSPSSGTFSVDSVCPACGGVLTYKWWSTLGAEVELNIIDNAKISIPSGSGSLGKLTERCDSCGYEKTEWKCLGLQGGDSKPGNITVDKMDTTNAGANIPAAGGRNPKGYGDEGKANVNSNGKEILWVEPFGIDDGRTDCFFLSPPSNLVAGRSASGTSFPYQYFGLIYYFEAPVTGLYYIGSSGDPYDFGSFNSFDGHNWSLRNFVFTLEKPYYASISLNKGQTAYLRFYYSYTEYNNRPYKFYLNNIPVFVDPLDGSSITNTNNITINNNTWNGNIYTDNSTNLTYIYPQYTTINEKNETVTNISNTPIIYNNETKQYYTYDQTTKNYYYITYNSDPAPSPTPTPAPTDKPGGSISTPETGKPGGSSGSSWWDKLLSKIGDAIIDGLLGAVSAVLKLIFKLLSTILSWIIWAVSRVFDLLPFLPPGLGGLLVGGVVVCFVIGIIKFIRG